MGASHTRHVRLHVRAACNPRKPLARAKDGWVKVGQSNSPLDRRTRAQSSRYRTVDG
jgi:hypothetical protein